MLDKSIPHIGVLMTKTDTKIYPRFELPEGYTFTGYRSGLEADWANLQFLVEQTDTFEEAQEIFKRDFLPLPHLLPTHCLFVLDSKGQVVATASLWHGDSFGQPFQRIHWVTTAPQHQGKGLAKALLTQLLDLYNKLYDNGFIYLTSQTWSYKALNIYSKFGFVPYKGPKPANWTCTDEEFQQDEIRAWEIIDQKIKFYSK